MCFTLEIMCNLSKVIELFYQLFLARIFEYLNFFKLECLTIELFQLVCFHFCVFVSKSIAVGTVKYVGYRVGDDFVAEIKLDWLNSVTRNHFKVCIFSF